MTDNDDDDDNEEREENEEGKKIMMKVEIYTNKINNPTFQFFPYKSQSIILKTFPSFTLLLC